MRRMRLRSLIKLLPAALLFCALQRTSSAQAVPCLDADLIVRNGHIVTMADGSATVSAMAIRDGKIQAVGTDAEITGCASPRTKTVDLQGRTVLPGLIDVHTHVMEWAEGILREQLDVTYPKVRSIADIVAMVRERAAKTPKGKWITGAGWDDAKFTEHRYITRQDLDTAAPDNPVYLDHVSGHLIAVNSAALKLAAVTSKTADPNGGVIEKDATGEPTGILKDTAMDLAGKLLPHDPPDIHLRAAK
jgi:hypothetical protein